MTPAGDSSKSLAQESTAEEMYMVVGFEVSPCSLARKSGQAVENIVCENDTSPRLPAQVRISPLHKE